MTLAEIAGMLDSKRRVIGKTLADLGQNPGDVLSQWGAQIKEDLGAQQGRDLRTFGMMGAGDFQGAAQNASSDYMPLAMLGMTAYHGSPHLFDKFDMSKIGTGEGAQAYGHGLYFAENPQVAKQYQDMLTGKTSGGKPLNWDDPLDVAAMRLHQFSGDANAAIKFETMSRADPLVSKENSRAAGFTDQVLEALRNGSVSNKALDKGNLYKVDIPDEHVAKMLDWDKPLSEQPHVLDVVKRVAGPNGQPEKWTGQEAYDALRMIVDPNGTAWPQAASGASKLLRDAGVPGIRYLDGGSRGKGGTSNFVVFDDAIPQIVGRE